MEICIAERFEIFQSLGGEKWVFVFNHENENKWIYSLSGWCHRFKLLGDKFLDQSHILTSGDTFWLLGHFQNDRYYNIFFCLFLRKYVSP